MNIKENCKILKLSYIFKNYEEEIKEAKQTKKDVGIFLDELLEKEINQRKDNGIKKRLRYAKFPIKKYLEDFDRKLYNPEFMDLGQVFRHIFLRIFINYFSIAGE